MITSGQFRLFRFAGIQVYLHWSWFLVALFEIEARAGAYSAPGWNVLEYLALFAIVTVHEFGHALACRSVGGTPERIMLWPFGGVAYVNPPQRPGATLWSVAAGPLVNVVLAPLLWLLAQALSGVGGANLTEFVHAVELINIGLLIFNILPVYPLDGGQILRSLLWYPLGRAHSLMVSTVLGLVGVSALGVFALRSGDLWLMAISAYIAWNCWQGWKHALVLRQMARLPRRPGLSCPSCETSPPLGLYWRCGNCRQSFDTFATAGLCPTCSRQFDQTVCLDCGRKSSLLAWRPTIVVTAR